MRRTVLILCCCCALLIGAAPAFASGSPSQNAYSGVGSQQLSRAQSSSTSSTLPFTGLNVGLLAIVAVALGGAGLLLRARTRSQP
ncbi:MAG TPA: hypothetical protein VKV27_14595 [Solirubrobacteraceae bacterium]|nr:hypothetical protein [Solirubrobacteraceae bacterium]